jgi:hypothetical protein
MEYNPSTHVTTRTALVSGRRTLLIKAGRMIISNTPQLAPQRSRTIVASGRSLAVIIAEARRAIVEMKRCPNGIPEADFSSSESSECTDALSSALLALMVLLALFALLELLLSPGFA